MKKIVIKDHNDFFEIFGQENESQAVTFPSSNSFEKNVRLLAAHYDNIIEPGHGMFFDFTATPEYEKPVLHCLQQRYNWCLEKPFFIRKPEE